MTLLLQETQTRSYLINEFQNTQTILAVQEAGHAVQQLTDILLQKWLVGEECANSVVKHFAFCQKTFSEGKEGGGDLQIAEFV